MRIQRWLAIVLLLFVGWSGFASAQSDSGTHQRDGA